MNALLWFGDSPITLGDGVLRLSEARGGIRGLRRPVLPSDQILLEEEPGPAVVPVGEEHPAVEIVEIGGVLHGGQSGIRSFTLP